MALTKLTKPRARWATFKLKVAQAVERVLYDKLYDHGVSVKDYGAVGDNVADDTDALNAAFSSGEDSMLPKGEYKAKDVVISYFSYDVKTAITGKKAIVNCENLYIRNCSNLVLSGIVFNVTGNIYIEGFRFGKMTDVNFNGVVNFGRFNETPAISSWSIYWSTFTDVQFNGGIKTRTSISSANFNSNLFSNCTFRKGTQAVLWELDDVVGKTDRVFVSNTFSSCDFSYAPVFSLLKDFGDAFAITVVGGYLDTGTQWWAGANIGHVDVLGLRNPSGHTFTNEYTSALNLTTGGARPRRSLPVGAVSYLKNVPTEVKSATNQISTTVPLPADGDYTFNFTGKGTTLGAIAVTNLTQGTPVTYTSSAPNGYSSYTFHANEGDVMQFLFDGDASADVDVLECSVTAGAGVYSAIPNKVINPYEEEVTNLVANGSTVDMLTVNEAGYQMNFYDVEVQTKTPVTGGGGELILVTLGVVSGGTGVNVTITERSRTSSNGLGGTSDDAGTVTLGVTTSGRDWTLTATLSGNPASSNVTVKRGYK